MADRIGQGPDSGGLLLILATLLLTICPGCASRRAPVGGASPSLGGEALPLEPGDAIRLRFSRETEMDGTFRVDEENVVVLPILGERVIRGLSPLVLKGQIRGEYDEQLRNQAVEVTPLRRVRVLGEVRSPGLLDVDPTMTLDDAIALAGGATSVGNLGDVRLIRDGAEVASGLDVRSSAVVGVRSGDQIYVPKTGWVSRNSTMLVGALISATVYLAVWGILR